MDQTVFCLQVLINEKLTGLFHYNQKWKLSTQGTNLVTHSWETMFNFNEFWNLNIKPNSTAQGLSCPLKLHHNKALLCKIGSDLTKSGSSHSYVIITRLKHNKQGIIDETCLGSNHVSTSSWLYDFNLFICRMSIIIAEFLTWVSAEFEGWMHEVCL